MKNDFMFRLDCGFLFSDILPSKASFSRLVQKLEKCKGIEVMKNQLLLQAIQEEFIDDFSIAIDAAHFESRDRGKAEDKKPKPEPKKRGRKSKAEKEAYDQQKQEEQAQQTLFEKSIAAQLDVSFKDLRDQMPQTHAWGIPGFTVPEGLQSTDRNGLETLYSTGSLVV